MVEEYNSIMVNDVWEVVPRPQDKLVVGLRWIYKVKYAAEYSVEKYKARFVAKGYAQKEGIDYEETFAPVARYTSIRTMIFLATQMGWEIHQMDVKTTFLNGVIEEEVYIEQPEGFETHEKKSHVCRLKKALYGLKQALRAWIIQARQILQEEPSHKIRHEGFGTDALFPGVRSWATEGQLIVSLMYLVNTKPNICYAVNTLSQFMVEPKRAHWAATKHVLRYIQGTIEHGLLYTRGNDIRLSGFIDAEWAGSSVDRKSTTGYCFNIGSKMISRCSRKHKSVALSSVEAEYMAATIASCKAIWLRKLFVNLFRRRMEATRIMCDNQSCIKLSENLVFHDQSKHIDIRCHFVRHRVQRGAVQLRYTRTGEQVVDILTKALGRSKFVYFKEKMGMVKNPF
eukprot:PITA_08736